jgi:hypothetical protein
VLGGADASHEMSGLRNEEAAMVEAANERVQVLIRHSRWCIEHIELSRLETTRRLTVRCRIFTRTNKLLAIDFLAKNQTKIKKLSLHNSHGPSAT